MPLYDYECPNCKHTFEAFKTIAERENAWCPICQEVRAKQIISAPAVHVFQPFWHEDFCDKPILVESKSHYKQLCKQYGVYAPHVFGTSENISEI